MSSPFCIVFSAPQGWGKTRKAEQLRQEFGCQTIVDDWMPHMELTPNALHFTHLRSDEITQNSYALPYRLVARGW